MANEIASILPTILNATTLVAREAVGILPTVALNADATRCAVGTTITSHVAPARPARDITPATDRPATTTATYGTRSFTISKSRAVDVTWSGREQIRLDSAGRPFNVILRDDFAQAFRTITNEVETDLALTAYLNASRAVGTSGTLPYASDLTAASLAEQILNDNGAPRMRYMAINSNVVVQLRNRVTLNDPSAAVQEFIQQGTLITLAGLQHKYTNGIQSHTKGAGASYLTDVAETLAVGAVTIHLDTGTGAVKAGDVVTFAGDTNQYVVKTGATGDGDKDIEIQAPGLRQTLADGVAMTITNSYLANLAYSAGAIELGTRAPEAPSQGDKATDAMMVKDPHSGLIFEVRYYPGYRSGSYEVGLNWGIFCPMPEWIAAVKG
jgi:hypothetical protein